MSRLMSRLIPILWESITGHQQPPPWRVRAMQYTEHAHARVQTPACTDL